MGFNNEETIIDALTKANGDVYSALDLLSALQDLEWYMQDFIY